MHIYFICVPMAQWDHHLCFGVLQRALVPYHLGQYGVYPGVAVLVLVLIGIIFYPVVSTLEVAQGPILDLILGYPPSGVAWGDSDFAAFQLLVVALVEGRPC